MAKQTKAQTRSNRSRKAWVTMRKTYTPEEISERASKAARKGWERRRAWEKNAGPPSNKPQKASPRPSSDQEVTLSSGQKITFRITVEVV